jgi:hypothetical protein
VQGALDGGLDIPHNEKRMVGYDKSGKKMDAEVLSKYIYGGHVEEYMETMQEEEPEKYQVGLNALLLIHHKECVLRCIGMSSNSRQLKLMKACDIRDMRDIMSTFSLFLWEKSGLHQ